MHRPHRTWHVTMAMIMLYVIAGLALYGFLMTFHFSTPRAAVADGLALSIAYTTGRLLEPT